MSARLPSRSFPSANLFLTSALFATLVGSGVALGQSAPVPQPQSAGEKGDSSGNARDAGGQRGDQAQSEQGGQRRSRQGGEGGQGGQGGQGGRGGRGMGLMQSADRYKPDFLRRDVPLFQEQLGLDQSQMAIVETLVNDYDFVFTPLAESVQQESRELWRSMFQTYMGADFRDRMRETFALVQSDLEDLAKEKGGELDEETRRKFFEERITKFSTEMLAERKASGAEDEARKVLAQVFEAANSWTAEKSKLRTTVVDGIQVVLTDDQRSQWPAFERYLRREKNLANATLSGEGVNLIFSIDEAGLPQDQIAKVDPLLNDYEMQLDNAIMARDQYLEQAEPKLYKALLDSNRTSAEQVVKRQVEVRRNLRDINDQFRVAILGVLAPESAAKFETASLTAGYSRVYRPTFTQRTLTEALEIEGLDSKVIEAIEALQAQYLVELSSLNGRITNAIRKQEPEDRIAESMRSVDMLTGGATPAMFMGRGGFGGGGGGNTGAPADEVREMFATRVDLGNKFLEQLHALLTPEQIALLPEGEERRSGGQGGGQTAFGGGGGAGGGGGMFGGGGPTRIADMPEGMQERMKVYDKNSDGTLDDAERQEAFAAFRGQMEQRGGQGGRRGQGGDGGQGGRGGDGSPSGQGGQGGRGGQGQPPQN